MRYNYNHFLKWKVIAIGAPTVLDHRLSLSLSLSSLPTRAQSQHRLNPIEQLLPIDLRISPEIILNIRKGFGSQIRGKHKQMMQRILERVL